MNYYNEHPDMGGVFSRDNLPTLEDKFYILNLDDQAGGGTHWVVLHNVGDRCIYFDRFGVNPPEEALDKMRKTAKEMIMNTYRIQAQNSINCGKYCIYVIDMLGDRSYIDILADFYARDYSMNDELIGDYI